MQIASSMLMEVAAMAVETRKFVVCDIECTDGAIEGIKFGYDGEQYIIDLMPHHSERLRDALTEFIGHASRDVAIGTTTSIPLKQKRKVNEKHQAVRAWATETGRKVPSCPTIR
jgi:hypothetical protein